MVDDNPNECCKGYANWGEGITVFLLSPVMQTNIYISGHSKEGQVEDKCFSEESKAPPIVDFRAKYNITAVI